MFSRTLLVAATLACSSPAFADDTLRIERLQRCDDLLDRQQQTFCLDAKGMGKGPVEIRLGGKTLPDSAIQRDGDRLRVQLNYADWQSGPLWLQQGGTGSNAVWLSMAGSHVLAATPDEVAKNMDGLTTYVNLISLIIEERFDGREEAQSIARKFGATVVGSIAPLNTWQLRLPVKNLVERDAMVLRMGSEVSVDAVVIEESQAEAAESEAPPSDGKQEKPTREQWTANRFMDAVNYYQRRIPGKVSPIKPVPIRIGIIERNVDFDTPDFADYRGDCHSGAPRTCVFARDARRPDGHGTTVTGILAANTAEGGNTGFLRSLDGASQGFDVIVERNSDAGIAANVAASVNLVEDGVRVLNWSWGIHRIGAKNIQGDDVDSLIRSGLAMSGYEELLEEFFLWLREKHPDVLVVNSAGNGSSFSSTDEYRLPSSFITDQLLVVGGHQRTERDNVAVDDPAYVEKRASSNVDMRVDIMASACTRASTAKAGEQGAVHCGTSYATPMVTGMVAAMLSINPRLTPEQIRMLLRRSAMTIGSNYDFEPVGADDLTAPILPSEREFKLHDKDVGRSARLDMQKALDLTVQSLDRVR
ncbi:S8/S53 family peptidase [Pseudomonas alliivorans]|nr:S8/S53 family peptidase [Pseudomonas alliivorans]MEE4694867.1 S8/S53 family peptidase [Pseudomonas alliivorans]MEE4888616.1 S8/S53 family peptidase [Pseudomonas alliivorans]MEE4892790.1 S8/S53 family peptidase [Pseudomonas alliivorans]MEE5055626.1 S8/S53 family peptidase [Pseudomonas alliivorans]